MAAGQVVLLRNNSKQNKPDKKSMKERQILYGLMLNFEK